MTRTPNTQERRKQIVLALQQVMAKKGYEGSSVQEIAAAAGLAPGLVHYHYKTKQEILLALLDHLVELQSNRLDQALEGLHGLEALDRFIDAHLALGRSADPEALACWIALNGEAIRQPEVGEAFGRALATFRAQLLTLLKEGAGSGSFLCTVPEEAASAIFAAIQGYFALAATARNLIPKGSAAPAVRSMARALVVPAGSSSRSGR